MESGTVTRHIKSMPTGNARDNRAGYGMTVDKSSSQTNEKGTVRRLCRPLLVLRFGQNILRLFLILEHLFTMGTRGKIFLLQILYLDSRLLSEKVAGLQRQPRRLVQVSKRQCNNLFFARKCVRLGISHKDEQDEKQTTRGRTSAAVWKEKDLTSFRYVFLSPNRRFLFNPFSIIRKE
jgi:hypothetical protein